MNTAQQQDHISSFNRPVFTANRQSLHSRIQHLLAELYKDLAGVNIRHLLLLLATTLSIVLPVSSYVLGNVVVQAGDNLSQHRIISLFMDPQSSNSHQSLKNTLMRYQQIQNVTTKQQPLQPALPGLSFVTVVEVIPARELPVTEVDELVTQLQSITGVEFVQRDNSQITRNDKGTRLARTTAFSIYVLSAVLLSTCIFMLIRKDLKSSAIQVQIRQKLGATNWQIMQPHLVRGALLGLFAGIIGIGMALGLSPIADFAARGTSFTIDTSITITQILILAGFVVSIAAASTSAALKKLYFQ